MITIERISEPILDSNGDTEASGCVSLSNNVDVWFSKIHAIKTLEEAIEVANIIIQSLNQKP